MPVQYKCGRRVVLIMPTGVLQPNGARLSTSTVLTTDPDSTDRRIDID